MLLFFILMLLLSQCHGLGCADAVDSVVDAVVFFDAVDVVDTVVVVVVIFVVDVKNKNTDLIFSFFFFFFVDRKNLVHVRYEKSD